MKSRFKVSETIEDWRFLRYYDSVKAEGVSSKYFGCAFVVAEMGAIMCKVMGDMCQEAVE